MARDNNMSQLDYLWTYFGKYKVSELVSDNPSDENILTEKALLDFINASILSRKVVSTLLYRKSSKPDTMEIVGIGTDGAEVTSIEVPAEVHVEKFEIRLITQEDIEKGSEIPLDSKVLSLVLTNGTEFLVSLELLNLEIQGYESDTIKTDVVNHVVKSDLKINKGNNTLSVIKIRTNNNGVWGDLEVSPKTTGVVLTKLVNGLEASIPIQNTENNILFMLLTLEHYLGLDTKDPGMVYFITDKPYIYLSGMRYGLDVQLGTYLITGLSFDLEKMALIVSYLGKENEEVPIGEATEDSNGLMTSQMVLSLKECIKYKEIVDNYTVNGHKISENPILTKLDVELENVDNTSDLDKPISKAVLEELKKYLPAGDYPIYEEFSGGSTPDKRKALVLKNFDTILGQLADGSDNVTLIMISKLDKVEVGSSKTYTNINSKDGLLTLNDTLKILTSADFTLVEDCTLEGDTLTKELTPNKLYKFGEINSLTITLGEPALPYPNFLKEYKIILLATANTRLLVTSHILYEDGTNCVFEEGFVYLITITDNLLSYKKYKSLPPA